MISLVKTEFGLSAVIKGSPDLTDAGEFYNQANKLLMEIPRGFYLLLDIREMQPLPKEVITALKNIQTLFLAHGLRKAAVITSNDRVSIQLKKVSLETGLFDKEIYLNSGKYPDWEKRAIKWFKLGIDPDNSTRIRPKVYDYSPA